MSLVYITGISGMGKSTVLKEMVGRGIEAYGIDEYPLGVWIHRDTGEIEDLETAAKVDGFDIHAWFKNHSWNFDVKKVKNIAEDAKSSTVYMCGVADGYDKVKSYISRVIVLHTDDVGVLKERIRNRTDNDFGKHPRDLE